MILFIDTSQDQAHLALADKNKFYYQTWPAYFRHSETLLPKIKKLSAKAKVSVNDLKGIIVVKGPGSYTGLRVGVASANALAYALKIPIIGVTTEKVNKIYTKKIVNQYYDRLIRSKYSIAKTVIPFYKRKPHITKPRKTSIS